MGLVQEQGAALRSRSDRAESRAATTLGATGIVVGLVVGATGFIDGFEMQGWWLLAGVLAASLILLLKAALYSLRALDALRGYELSADAALQLAALPKDEAEREELAARTWEVCHLLPLANERLYYAQRGQKNLGFSVGMLGVGGALIFLGSQSLLIVSRPLEVVGAIAALAVAIGIDALHERIVGLWRRDASQ